MKPVALALMIVLAGVAAGEAGAVSLRPIATVDDGLIRLGDLFEEVGNGADIAIAHAPAPGRRTTFDAAALAKIARAYRLDWRPQSRFDRVVVERAGRIIPKAEIVAQLAEALRAEGMERGSEVEIAGRTVEMAVPLDAPDAVEVRSLSFDRRTGRFTAVVAAGDGAAAQRLAVTGRVHATSLVPVLRRPMSNGDVIREGDIEMIRIREDRIGRDIILDPRHLVGTTPRHRLRAGDPIRANETHPPIVVERNSIVTIVLQTSHMTLTAQGRAAEDGARGDTIRVVNLQSKKTVEAVVAGPDHVTVEIGRHLTVN